MDEKKEPVVNEQDKPEVQDAQNFEITPHYYYLIENDDPDEIPF